MFDPQDDQSMKKLRGSLVRSHRKMKSYRDKRREAQKEMLGRHYPELGTGTSRPLNLVELASSIYLQHLVASAPQVNITPTETAYKPHAKDLSLAMNKLFERGELGVELELWVLEAMFAPMGVLKVFLDVQDVAEIDGQQVWTGPPTAQAILFDDWVQDMSAKSPNKVAYCGDRWQCTREWAMTSGVLDPDAVAKLPEKDRGNDDPYSAFRDNDHDDDYREILELWDIWLPDEGKIVTLYKDFESHAPLRVVDWSGPAKGPYHRLWFGAVPGSSLPNPPAWLWLDLHEVVNTLWNKLIDQAKRQKTISAVESGNIADGETLKNASDGDMVRLNQLAGMQQLKSGGIAQENYVFAESAFNAFDRHAGNLSALGGLGAMSGTVGQDQMLTSQASQRLQKMQAKVYTAMRSVAQSFAEHLWSDPILEIPISQKLGNGYTKNDTWRLDKMAGHPANYKIDIEPFSLQPRSPTEMLESVRDYWTNGVLPSLPIFQAVGQIPNPEAYLAEWARLARIPQALQFVAMQTEAAGEAKAPTTTTRQYVRKSQSTQTPQGQRTSLAQQMMATKGSE